VVSGTAVPRPTGAEAPDVRGRLGFRNPEGQDVEVPVRRSGPWARVNEVLRFRTVELAPWGGPGTVRQIGVVEGLQLSARARAYELLDNETLAGLRLARLARRVPGQETYPAHVSRLVGYDGFSADQFVLVEPYRGAPVEEFAGHLVQADQHRFAQQLTLALRWIAQAGIAHRGLSPRTVLWADGAVQVVDFCHAALVGTPRQTVGSPPWAAREQRADGTGTPSGRVTDRDDVWAVARLICYVISGFELTNRAQLDQYHLSELLGDALGPVEHRPGPAELLARLRLADPLRRVQGDDVLVQGRQAFLQAKPAAREYLAQAGRVDLTDAARPSGGGPPDAPRIDLTGTDRSGTHGTGTDRAGTDQVDLRGVSSERLADRWWRRRRERP
jgi:hypothetical protein